MHQSQAVHAQFSMWLITLLLPALAAASGSGQYAYRGQYGGKCGNDGLYYNSASSFIFCSNGNSYHQPCAPGTKNSGADKYSHGSHYSYRDFCDVNLVDYGYGKRSGYGSSQVWRWLRRWSRKTWR